MYQINRNNYRKNQKNSTVYTPPKVSSFLFKLLHHKIDENKIILDPCVGAGSLLKPFDEAGYKTLGIDIKYQGYKNTQVRDFISMGSGDFGDTPIGLVIVNPPFNVNKPIFYKDYGSRPLLPEVFLAKIIELWGNTIPIVLFTPYGLRLNQIVKSRRWKLFVEGYYPPISSIISLPKNVFDNVLFHSEVLIFNVKRLAPHYFYNS